MGLAGLEPPLGPADAGGVVALEPGVVALGAVDAGGVVALGVDAGGAAGSERTSCRAEKNGLR